MYNYSLSPLTTLPTRVAATSSTLIDHIWSTQVENNVANYIIKTDITDHYPVVSVFKCDQYFCSRPTYTIKRRFKHCSLDRFYKAISQTNWSHIENCSCPNEAYKLFFAKLKYVFDTCFPVTKVKVNCKKYRCPYIIQALRISIREKNRLEKLAYKWPLTLKKQYKKYRNKLVTSEGC